MPPPNLNRRQLLKLLSTTALASAMPASAPANIRYGYAAITWADKERQAIDDISSVGFPGIQLRANVLTDFKPAELKDLLAAHKLTFVALSSGEISLDAPPADEIAKHVANAQYVKDAGGLYLQILDKLLPYPRKVAPDEATRLGPLLTEIGKRTADLGIPLVYHNHLNTISEHPDNLQRIMQTSDPKSVHLLLDIAHLTAGGGDPVKAINQYHSRIKLMHLKDYRDSTLAENPRYPFQWVELGRGQVDITGTFAALKSVHYKGWAVVELDRVPDPARTPKDCALINRNYLNQKMQANI